VGLYRRVLSYVGRYPGLISATIAATLGFAILDAFSMLMLIPFLNQLFGSSPFTLQSGQQRTIGWLLNNTIGRLVNPAAAPQRVLLGIIVFILVVFLVKNVFDFLQEYLSARLEQKVTRDLRNQVYSHLLRLDLDFFSRTRAGQIISRMTNDVDQLRMLVTKNIAKLATSLFQIIATLAAALMISVPLTVVAIVVLPGMFSIWGRMLRTLRKGDRQVLDLAGDVSSHLQESVAGIRLVKSFAAEDFEDRRFRRLTQRYYRTYVRTEALRALAGPLTEMMGAFGTVLLLWYGTRMVLVDHALDGATFITFLALSMKLYAPVKWTSKFPSVIQPGLAAADRIFEFLDAPIRIRDRAEARDFTGAHELIRFEDVSFRYEPDEPVLKDVSFDVRRGEVVALVGPSGAGKTTVVELLARMHEPDRGRITIDGVDLCDFRLGSLRSNLGTVTQETVLLHDTVRANIGYGLDVIDDAAVERAARAAYAHEFIIQLPNKYETLLGERGTRLSGGERQRIAIARALLRDPPILIFDEATSSLDTESERLVQAAIERLLEGRTVFVIAHRLSTVRHADRILVLQGGRILEQGRHDELLAKGGLYRRLYELQFADTVTTASGAARAAAEP
jgi:ATP-binding cassette, subfamily B, bacterial MsbA